MIRNTQPWAMTARQAKHAEGRHCHKLRETWKNVPESTMKEVSKAAGLYQSLPQGEPDKPIRKCKSSVGTSSNLNNPYPLLQTSKTSQSKVSDSISQPSSRAAKSGKFRAVKHSGIHLEVLSLENRNSLNISSVFTEL